MISRSKTHTIGFPNRRLASRGNTLPSGGCASRPCRAPVRRLANPYRISPAAAGQSPGRAVSEPDIPIYRPNRNRCQAYFYAGCKVYTPCAARRLCLLASGGR